MSDLGIPTAYGAWALASLRIASETILAEEIGERLGLRPTSWRQSEGEPAFVVWIFESGMAPSAPLEDHLYILMERLAERRDALMALVDDATVEIWLSFSTGSNSRTAVLNADLLSRVSAAGIDLVLDPYPQASARRPRPDETDDPDGDPRGDRP
ncbi:MAG: DUF4279 domain-containing protein [Microthrixaceae bacterium]